MTGRDLVESCLIEIGALAPGENASAAEASQGLTTLNNLLDGWSTKKLMIYEIAIEATLTLTVGQAAYTLGSGGDLNTSRPIKIQEALIRDSSGSGNPRDYPITRMLSTKEYAELGEKGVSTDYPYALYDAGGNPLRTIYLYPTPSAAHTLVLFSLKPLTAIASLSTTLAFPPGYHRALVKNGAIEFAPQYGKQVTPALVQAAQESKGDIQRANQRDSFMKVDPSIPGGESGQFNIYTGDSSR